jgi:hypothetical protein
MAGFLDKLRGQRKPGSTTVTDEPPTPSVETIQEAYLNHRTENMRQYYPELYPFPGASLLEQQRLIDRRLEIAKSSPHQMKEKRRVTDSNMLAAQECVDVGVKVHDWAGRD